MYENLEKQQLTPRRGVSLNLKRNPTQSSMSQSRAIRELVTKPRKQEEPHFTPEDIKLEWTQGVDKALESTAPNSKLSHKNDKLVQPIPPETTATSKLESTESASSRTKFLRSTQFDTNKKRFLVRAILEEVERKGRWEHSLGQPLTSEKRNLGTHYQQFEKLLPSNQYVVERKPDTHAESFEQLMQRVKQPQHHPQEVYMGNESLSYQRFLDEQQELRARHHQSQEHNSWRARYQSEEKVQIPTYNPTYRKF